MPKKPDPQVIIVGAGPAGAIAAFSCARVGLSVLLLEAAPEKEFGNPCVIELDKATFAACAVPEPPPDEIAFVQKGARIFSPGGVEVMRFNGHAMYAVYLQPMVRRLAGYARDAGAQVKFGWRVEEPIIEGERVTGVVVRSPKGRRSKLQAQMVIDATGIDAVLTRQLPAHWGMDFVDRPTDHVLAESRMYKIDVDKARAAVDAGLVLDDITMHQVGQNGSYSTHSVFVSLKNRHAFLLVGVKEENAPPTAAMMIDNLAVRCDFLTKEITRGSNTIPIRRAGARLVADGFATIGDAGRMVVPLHASGVTSGMLAGHGLALQLSRILRSGRPATTEALWPWLAAYQRGRGAVLASYDANRRILEKLDPMEQSEPLMRHGVMQTEDMEKTLTAKPLRISAESVPGRLFGITQAPRTAIGFLSKTWRSFACEAHWRRFPERWDYESFYRWKRRANQLLP
ncbi:MAG: FAD-binding protein [Candidatus Lernaella stagnicola]|nr:FAD-binding protein [Candidatus Lernaella stagnicola]